MIDYNYTALEGAAYYDDVYFPRMHATRMAVARFKKVL
jgi:hypothetical protein